MTPLRTLTLCLPVLFLAGASAGYWLPPDRKILPSEETAPVLTADNPDSNSTAQTAADAQKARPAGEAVGKAWDFITLLQNAKAEDMRGIWASLPARGENMWQDKGPTPEQLLAMERWAELEPQTALDFAKMAGPNGAFLLEAVFRTWGRTDADAALAAIKSQIPVKELQMLCGAGLIASAGDDPARAVSLVQRLTWMDMSKLEEKDFMQFFPEEMLQRMIGADGEGMKGLTSWLPPWFAGRLEALEMSRMLKTDPAAAEFLKTMKWDDALPGRLAPALTELARTNPQAAADWLDRVGEKAGGDKGRLKPNDTASMDLIRTLMESLGPKDPERMRDILLKRSERGMQFAASNVMSELLLQHPAEALRIAPALPSMDSISVTSGPVAAVSNPAETLALVREAPASWHRDQLMEKALFKMNPAEASAWVESLPEGEMRTAARVTLEMAGASPELRSLEQAGRAEILEGMDGAARERIKGAVTYAAMTNAELVAERIAGWPVGEMRDYAMNRTAVSWAGQDTGAAMEWAAALPDAASQAAAFSGVLETWTDHEPRAASEWMAAQEPGPVRDAAAGAFVSALSKLDPEAAAQWAATIGDSGARETKLQEIFNGWQTKNAAAATEALKTLPGLSAQERQALQEHLSKSSTP